jgi:hypothetical protein
MCGHRIAPSGVNSATPVVVARHHGVGDLAAQRLDLEAVGDRLHVAHGVS